MRKKAERMAALALAGALGLGLAACSEQTVTAALPAEEDTGSEAAWEPADYVDEERSDKTETVYIEAAADGTPERITVEAVLKNPGGSGEITDVCDLPAIKNTEGDEEYTRQGNTVVWQNHGEDIHYKGDTDAQLPVGVQVEYLLDGQPAEPRELIGKSGRLTIRFTYDNRETRTVTEGGKTYAVCVPFTAVTLLTLPADTFYNVKVDNGQVTTMDDSTVVLGYALPGLSDSLRLAGYEPTEEIEIPESVEVTCQVVDFELEFTATVITPGLLSDAELDELSDIEDFIDDMDELADGVDELADGTRELNDGVQELYDGVAEYTDGVDQVNDAVKEFEDALREAADRDSELVSGLRQVSDGWITVLAQLLGDTTLNGENYAQELPAALKTYAGSSMLQQAQSALLSTAAAMTAWPAGEQAVGVITVPEEMQALLGNEISADIRQSLVNALLTDSLNTVYEQRLLAMAAVNMAAGADQTAAISGAMGQWIAARLLILSGDADAEAGALLADSLTEEEQAAWDSLTAAAAAQLAESLTALVSGTAALPDTLSKAFGEMADGVGELQEGTQALSDAGGELRDGIRELHDGTTELADGVQEFRNDGVSALTDLAGDELQELVNRVRAVQKADQDYSSFTGLAEGKTGSVSFILETAELKKE